MSTTEALRELLEAMTAQYPSASAGQEAQTAWGNRQTAAVSQARAALAATSAPAELRADALCIPVDWLDAPSGILLDKLSLAAGAAMGDAGFSGLTRADIAKCNCSNVGRNVVQALARFARRSPTPIATSAPSEPAGHRPNLETLYPAGGAPGLEIVDMLAAARYGMKIEVKCDGADQLTRTTFPPLQPAPAVPVAWGALFDPVYQALKDKDCLGASLALERVLSAIDRPSAAQPEAPAEPNGREFPVEEADAHQEGPPLVLRALLAAQQFIQNGCELGYIRMPDPDTDDSAHQTAPLIDAAISELMRATPPTPAASSREALTEYVSPAGLCRVIADDDSILRLQFRNEEEASAFMNSLMPTVDIDSAPPLPDAAAEVEERRELSGIYVASRASSPARPAMWRRLREEGWPITSTWIDEAGEGQTADIGELWARIDREVRSSYGLIVYAEPEDFPLKGAYIEAGIALGAGLPVAVVMPGVLLEARSDRPMGSWIRHPLVTICDTLEEARAILAASKEKAS